MPLAETLSLLKVKSLTTTFAKDVRAYGDSVRVRKANQTGWEEPKHFCLIYLKFESNNRIVVRHMYTRDITAGLDATQQKLFTDAEDNKNISGTDFNTIAFHGPCYFAIFIDNDEWDFYYPQSDLENPIGADDHDPILFIDRKAIIKEVPGQQPVLDEKTYLPNHTFYDCERTKAKNGAGAERAGVRCRNYFKDQHGNVLGNVTETFGFQIHIQIPFAVTTSEGRKLIIIIDPDGQNQGPPP